MATEDRHDNYLPLAVGGGLLVLLLVFIVDLSAEVWAVRVQIVVGYVLVLTLLVVSRNTKQTSRMVDHMVTEAQASRLPHVHLKRQGIVDSFGEATYVHNAGPGVATDVVLV